MTGRLRISHVVVQPVLVWDDGEELAPGPGADAFPVSLADLAGLADRLRADVERLTVEVQAAGGD